MKRQLLLFLVLASLLAAAAAPFGWLFAGELGLLHVAGAFLICMVPMTATMIWTSWSRGGCPERQLAAVLGGTSLRLAFALGVGITLFMNVPAFKQPAFLFWVIFFYLTTLALEITLLVAMQKKTEASARSEPKNLQTPANASM